MSIARGQKLKPALAALNITPFEFFKYLDDNPELKVRFDRARQVALELELEGLSETIRNVRSTLDFDKIKLQVGLSQWFAEKLIPKVYGSKVLHSHEHTINLVKVLEDAERRLQVPAIDTQCKRVPEESETLDPAAQALLE